MDLLQDLNPEQRAAVEHKDGPLLIVAGAGTGKTTVITRRFASLIAEGLAKPEEILALTFTEKAAAEMAERVEALLPYGYFDLWISTFHSFAERLLKEHGLSIGLPADFKLLNEFEQWALIKKNLDKFELDYYRPLGNPTKFIQALLKHFSRAKDEDVDPALYLQYASGLEQDLDAMLAGGAKIQKSLPTGRQAKVKSQNYGVASAIINRDSLNKEVAAQEAARINEVANAYHVYQQLLLDNNALDFGDLINYCLKLFRERPAILETLRRQFKYILLDEFQDTNWAQYELVKILAAPKNNLVVVGDDDQSIFRFRGASMSNIMQFVQDYSQAKKIILIKNYRSKQNILDLSYQFIIQNNPNRLEWQLRNPKPQSAGRRTTPKETPSPNAQKLNKKLVAVNVDKGEIKVIEGADLAEEVKLVVDKIVELKKSDQEATWNDFAILIRANDSARDFILELDRRGLPYIFSSSRGLYLKPLVMDVVSYFKLLDNYHESTAVWRVLNLPVFEFSDQELMNFSHLANKKALSLYEVLNQAEALKLSAELQEKIRPVLALIAKHSALAREKSASEVLLAFMNDSGYLKYLTGAGAGAHGDMPSQQKENIALLNQFLKRIHAFESASGLPRLARSSGEAGDKSVRAFLAELNLELEAGEEGGLSPDLDAGPEAIRILTVHSAKGLEFKYVFIANLVDKRFPTIERREQINLPDALIKEILPEGNVHLEEERRLFYVAMTRAKNGLFFSWASDYGGRVKKKPSRFLAELGLANQAPLIKGGKGGLRKNEFCKKENPEIPLTPARKASLAIAGGPFNKGGAIPSHFSYSQLAAYSNCPYQYRFAHILKIPVLGKEQFSFGKTMHATLQKLFVLINEKKGLKQPGLFGDSAPLIKGFVVSAQPNGGEGGLRGVITFEEILALYEQSWVDDWYESKSKKQERKKQGQEILRVFYEKHHDNWPEVLFLEKGFNLKITADCESYILRGAIDRIDQTDDGLKLVDYKTGSPKKVLKFEDKEQLYIYQLAARELFKEPIKSLAYYYLDDNSEREFIGGSDDLEKVMAKIILTIKEIRRGEFPPKPSRLCAWCDYRSICEKRE